MYTSHVFVKNPLRRCMNFKKKLYSSKGNHIVDFVLTIKPQLSCHHLHIIYQKQTILFLRLHSMRLMVH